MKNKFSPGEEVWIKAKIEEVRINHGGIDYRVSVNDNGIPLYDTIPEDAILERNTNND